jgi:hypothetical protein
VKRFLALFVLLLVAGFLAREAVALGVFRHVDARYVAFVQILCVPAFQAAVLAALSRRGGRPARVVLANLARRPALVGLFVAELLVVVGGWLGPHRGPHAIAVAVSALAAAAALVATVSQVRRGKSALLLLAAGLAVWAANAFQGFLEHAPEHLLPRVHVLLRIVVVLGGMLLLAFVLILGAASVARARRSASAVLFEVGAALTFLAALVVVLSFFLHPWLEPPWLSIEKSASYLALTAVLLGSVALLGDARATA